MRRTRRIGTGTLGLALFLWTGPVSAQSPVRLEIDAQPISISTVEGGMSIIATLEAIGEAFGFDVVTDPRLRDGQVEVSLTNLGPEDALDRVCVAAGLMWVALDERSVVVAEDNPQMRRKYEPLVVQTFYLENADVRGAMTLLRSMIGVRNVVAVDGLNAVTVRDTVRRVALARRLIEQNDQAPAILEVDVRIVQLSPDAMRDTLGTAAPPSRLAADRARELAAAGRLVARPILSFADGRRARVEIGPAGDASEGPAFALALSGRLAGTDPAVTLDIELEGDSTSDPARPPERRSLSSTARLEPGETWVVGGLFRAVDESVSEPDHVVVLLTPRVASIASVRAVDRAPVAVGTEADLGLEPDR